MVAACTSFVSQLHRKRYPDASDAQELADRIQEEINIWHAYSEFYGYEFFVLRAR